MFGSDILDVALGLVFVYLLMSLIATAAREAAETALKSRGQWLEKGLMELFEHQPGEDTLLERFYNYPLIYSLFREPYRPPERRASAIGNKLPSYIPATHFANSVLGVAESYLKADAGGQALSFDRLTLAAWAVPNEPVRRVMLLALASAKGDLDKTRLFLEDWYNGTMDRVAGWYKRQSQVYVFVGGLALCIVLNVNTMLIANALHQDPVLRGTVSTAAAKWVEQHPPAPPPAAAPDATAWFDAMKLPAGQLTTLELPIGWGPAMRGAMWAHLHAGAGANRAGQILAFGVGGLEILIGWLMTSLAITLGAPFWFDVLNTIMVVRSTVKPTEKSAEEPSKDGAGRAAATPTPAAQAVAAPNAVAALAAPGAGALEVAALDPALRPREEDQ